MFDVTVCRPLKNGNLRNSQILQCCYSNSDDKYHIHPKELLYSSATFKYLFIFLHYLSSPSLSVYFSSLQFFGKCSLPLAKCHL